VRRAGSRDCGEVLRFLRPHEVLLETSQKPCGLRALLLGAIADEDDDGETAGDAANVLEDEWVVLRDVDVSANDECDWLCV